MSNFRDALAAALVSGSDDAVVAAWQNVPQGERDALLPIARPILERWVARQALEAVKAAGLPARPIGKDDKPGHYVAVKGDAGATRVALTITL